MARTVSLDLLNSITVASPCTEDWDGMVGDDRVRHCGQCNLNVYNLSSMPSDEAAALVRGVEGRLCIRLYKRADGTVLAQDCPVGLRGIRIKTARAVGRLAAAAALLISGGLVAATGNRESRLPKLASMQPFSMIRAWLSPSAPVPVAGRMSGFVMGDFAAPVRAVPPSNGPQGATTTTSAGGH